MARRMVALGALMVAPSCHSHSPMNSQDAPVADTGAPNGPWLSVAVGDAHT